MASEIGVIGLMPGGALGVVDALGVVSIHEDRSLFLPIHCEVPV